MYPLVVGSPLTNMPKLNALAGWLGMSTAKGGQDDLRLLKTALTQQGVNSRGWRLYLDHGDPMFTPLLANWPLELTHATRGRQAIAWLCVLQGCEIDVLPPPELVLSVSNWDLPSAQVSAIPPLFLRAAWKALVAAQYTADDVDTDTFIEDDVVPLAQWFFRSGAYKTTGPDRLKAGWDSLKRLRRESVAVQAGQLSKADWPPVIHRYASGPYELIGLCHDTELAEEGEAMNHCVGTYGDRCRFAPLRIFSVRRKKCGTRVATLSVRENNPGCWGVDQLKGPSNAEVGQLLWPEIDGLLQTLDAVSRNDQRLRSYLDFLWQIEAENADEVEDDLGF